MIRRVWHAILGRFRRDEPQIIVLPYSRVRLEPSRVRRRRR